MAAQNSYFVPGYGISRAVIQNEIRYHCGPDAIVRPYTFQGRDGFLVSTFGPPLSKAQIDDLKMSSLEYEEKQSRIGGESEVFVNAPIPINQRVRRSQ
ncbi:hypothetical protein P153DRAFT_392461 [Dothidotthia symphoricarpi CBS 119687]|uniref:Uncharacterized protein n=1 Tax=Dothidotthia symphoricarpi CBS 119687 TaxID=1392245 RepID=A0A6A6AQL4_9PLEO|nr:uncharacterized protein P153DRAFT_392461 [Dothidotthia symphoricarpi CBS 119687]KAF2133816.1 hypothetical protein P153DRAFT_392461 [Dothidotthia symphoricarpi CBS 119687]